MVPNPTETSPWLAQQLVADPQATAIVDQYLKGLVSAGYTQDLQGVWLAVGPYPIAHHQEAQRLPAASLTKVATTLAALETWSLDHRFETLVGWRGTLANGILQGDLIVRGSDDPLFVWEEAIALGNALQALGIRQVTGHLIVTDQFGMNFQRNPATSGKLLKQAFNASQWSPAIQQQYQTLPAGTPKPQIQIDGDIQVATADVAGQASGWLVRHQSLPLIAILKAMNIYSNNVMADSVAQTLGGPTVVMRLAHETAAVPTPEINLHNGSGLGPENQISARAVVQMLQTIQAKLQSQQFTIADLFPVAGSDGGTLRDRRLPTHAVLKTGTLATVSALAGAFPTEAKGVVWFTLINYGGNIETLRSHQDQLLNQLEQRWGKASQLPDGLKVTVRFNQGIYRLGNPQRNQPLL
jgi:D-alanyl-D-alanine carboxypeptidase/D-alanyl-D-alanine-endopeptidase (penicillin-binding protein 4)